MQQHCVTNVVTWLYQMQVDSFLPCHLADMVSAYANMVHHPGPLLDQMTQRILPKLDTMDAGAQQGYVFRISWLQGFSRATVSFISCVHSCTSCEHSQASASMHDTIITDFLFVC